MDAHAYCVQTLQKVSRTFAINISFLRGDLYKSVLCAYLFCRIADTVEDSVFVDFDDQKQLLDDYKQLFRDNDFSAERLKPWVTAFHSAPKSTESSFEDMQLVENSRLVVENYLTLPEPYRLAINDCLIEMSEGMLDVLSRKYLTRGNLYYSRTINDLNRYCYYVAGTVGVLLTRLFAVYSNRIKTSIHATMDQYSVSFGLGLQITNIIKDCWGDYKRGWCYIPADLMRKYGFAPDVLFDPNNRNQAQQAVNALIRRAANHLDDALAYSLIIPRRDMRIRLFCLLPLFFAIATLSRAVDNPAILQGNGVKISRELVQGIIRKITLISWNNRLLRNYYAEFRIQIA